MHVWYMQCAFFTLHIHIHTLSRFSRTVVSNNMEVDDLDYFWTTSVLLAAVLLKYTHKYTPYVYVASGNIWDPALLTDIVTKLSLSLSLSPHIYIYIYIHRYVYIHIHVYICIPVYITYSWEEKLPHKQTNRINKRTNDQDIVLWPRTQSFAEK